MPDKGKKNHSSAYYSERMNIFEKPCSPDKNIQMSMSVNTFTKIGLFETYSLICLRLKENRVGELQINHSFMIISIFGEELHFILVDYKIYSPKRRFKPPSEQSVIIDPAERGVVLKKYFYP
jgi:hypothetical protein